MAAPSEYLRARRDAAFRERVEREYDGRHDVLDALWWREHPDAPSPAGEPAPSTRRAELQRVAFARAEPGAADAVPRADRAAAELRRLDAELAEERRAIDAAVAAASVAAATTVTAVTAARPSAAGHSASHPAGPDDEGLDDGVANGSGADGPADIRSAAPSPTASGLGRRRLAGVVAAAFAVAVLGGAAGFGLAQTVAASGGDAAGGDGAPFADAGTALAIFDRPQAPGDQPPLLYNVQLREETLRTLSMPGVPLYVARDIDGDVCVVLVQTNGTYSANCVPDDRFPATGLLIRGSIAVTGRPSQGDQQPQSFVDVEATWLPDGTTVWGQNPETRRSDDPDDPDDD
ncbi:hypothetical protein [Herbiconiux liangxiaofengii]|uniref:hypothetical protein n=1 Tax=Herbiconiux liangxiaofengii TaxID=3342795 RepID=UPI0035B8E0EC